MIYGRGKWLYEALMLVARDAARHFAVVRGKSPRGRNGSWQPLALQWRRRRKRSENRPTGHAATGSRIFWLPQFHFHYATQRNDRTRRDLVVALTAEPGVSESRVVIDRHWMNRPAGASAPPVSHADRTLRPFQSLESSRRARTAELKNTPTSLRASERSILAPQTKRVFRALRPFSAPRSLRQWSDTRVIDGPRSSRIDGHSIGAPSASRTRPLQLGRLVEDARARSPRAERVPFVKQSEMWHHWLQIFSGHPPAPGDLFSSKRKENKPVQVQLDRPEEFVWRRVAHPPREVDEIASRQEFSDSYEPSSLRSFESQEAVHVSPSVEQPAVQQIANLDPRVLDRLTDDVIRRVEQRIRIERERRGL